MDIPKRSSNFSQSNREPSNKTNEQKMNIITNCMNLGKKRFNHPPVRRKKYI